MVWDVIYGTNRRGDQSIGQWPHMAQRDVLVHELRVLDGLILVPMKLTNSRKAQIGNSCFLKNCVTSLLSSFNWLNDIASKVPPKKEVTLKRKCSVWQDKLAIPVKRARTCNTKQEILQIEDPVAKAIRRQGSTSGATLTCGQGDTGQLGLGEEVLEKTRFTEVSKLKDVISVAGGGMHNIILTNDGCVATFGCNDEGALGRDITECGEATPGFVELPGRAIQVTAGDSHSAALLEDGRVYCWGAFRDSHGTLGLINRKKEETPIEILHNTKFLKIASGSDHIVLLDITGTVFTFGCAEQGQLGRVSVRKLDRHSRRGKDQLLTPEKVYFHIKKNIIIRNIWAGSFSTFAEAGNGDLYVSGLNNYNQIGLKGCDKTLHPKVSHTFSRHRWMQISSGQHHTVAVNDQGQVYTIGRKEYGRLGLGSLCEDAQELIPVPKLENLKCIDVAAGTAQSFAVTNTGTLYAWGMGSEGQLGTGKEEDIYEPELINSKHVKDAFVLQVSGGGQHTIILVKKPHSSLI
ncbi:regulator of chromosome condensation-like [Copidosoma floridanum]|uniref:regulator of chromosome condensation-like n=1 Tax=Copidosoma floridanum TaxID=29053 RepID=UPI000C6F9AA7|nr:regulator of chromosome condensation-like [Copidosoma floridanum]